MAELATCVVALTAQGNWNIEETPAQYVGSPFSWSFSNFSHKLGALVQPVIDSLFFLITFCNSRRNTILLVNLLKWHYH